MIRINLPGLSQAELDDAFAVLEECIVDNLPCLGFEYPFMGPGGRYGNCWWERDSALALLGYRFVDRSFTENALLNFTFVQKENGRIPLYGYDRARDFLDEQHSAIPVIYDTALTVLRHTDDRRYIRRIYDMLVRYTDWWLSDAKTDADTGLVCGIFEESDPCDHYEQKSHAQVDLNVQICIGADALAQIADYLALTEDAEKYRALFERHKEKINRYLYDEESGGYYTYVTSDRSLMTGRIYNSMLDTLRLGIAPAERVPRLLYYLESDRHFGLHRKYAIRTMSPESEEYTETVGVYAGHTSWMGNIWSFRNDIIVKGLREAGEKELSSELAYKTVTEFAGNCAEFLSPTDGRGHGVERYAWTAAQLIRLTVEELFGITDCAWDGSVTVEPNLPSVLTDIPVSISGVPVNGDRTVSVTARRLPDGNIEKQVKIERI